MFSSLPGKFVSKSTLIQRNWRNFFVSCNNLGEDESNKSKNNKQVASRKLNELLQSIVKQDELNHTKSESKLEVPKPKQKFKQRKLQEEKKDLSLGEKIVQAAKEVAEVVKGDKKENEIELLQKLLYKDSPLREEIAKAASPQLSEIISGMKVEKTKTIHGPSADTTLSRASQIRSALGSRERTSSVLQSRRPMKQMEHIDLFGGKPFNIFTSTEGIKTDDALSLKTWGNCNNREIRLSVTHPPSNIYEQMIIWTERGILWKFPIDNEQGLEEEKKVSFVDHVFLEAHLEGWCPPVGPIHHFMELVCVGLSRNHWLTAQEKKDHILWYKDYFSQKQELIKEIGAGEIGSSQS